MTAKYPVSRVKAKVFAVPKCNTMVNQENLFLGQLPKWLVIGMIDNKAFNGDKMKKPYNFNILMQITWLCAFMENKFHLNPSPLTLTMACVPKAMLHSIPALDLWDMIVEIKSVAKSIPEASHFLHLIWQQIWMMEDISNWWNKAIFDWNYISKLLCQRL